MSDREREREKVHSCESESLVSLLIGTLILLHWVSTLFTTFSLNYFLIDPHLQIQPHQGLELQYMDIEGTQFSP